MTKPDIEHIKQNIVSGDFTHREFKKLKDWLDLLDQSIRELLSNKENNQQAIAKNFIGLVKFQVYHENWTGETIAQVGFMIADYINTYPDVDWCLVSKEVDLGTSSMTSKLKTAISLKSLHTYGNNLTNTVFNEYNASNTVEELYFNKHFLNVNTEKIAKNIKDKAKGLSPTYAEQLDWSLPQARQNLLNTLDSLLDDKRKHHTDSMITLYTSGDISGRYLRSLSAVTELFIPALYDNLFDLVKENWSSYSDEQKAWHLFFGLAQFNSVFNTKNEHDYFRQKSVLMGSILDKYNASSNLNRLSFLTQKYSGMFEVDQLSYIDTYLTLIDQPFVEVKRIETLLVETKLKPIIESLSLPEL